MVAACSFLSVAVLLRVALAAYSPSSGADWRLYKPSQEPSKGSYDSLPFAFGLVVTPYLVDHHGNYLEPGYTSVVREYTTTHYKTHVTAAPKPTRAAPVHQIADGQVQKKPQAGFVTPTGLYEGLKWNKKRLEDDCDDEDFVSPVYAVACKQEPILELSLEDSILRDTQNRIGSIVGSRQFQFDGPVPQHGALYAAGWAISTKGYLELGGSSRFYQCASGEFHNLYDRSIGLQCAPVVLEVVELIDC